MRLIFLFLGAAIIISAVLIWTGEDLIDTAIFLKEWIRAAIIDISVTVVPPPATPTPTPTPTPAPAVGVGGGGGGGAAGPAPPPAPPAEAAYSTADFTKDGKIDLVDFSILLFNWGLPDNPIYDLNNDAVVDIIDFSIFLYYWTG